MPYGYLFEFRDVEDIWPPGTLAVFDEFFCTRVHVNVEERRATAIAWTLDEARRLVGALYPTPFNLLPSRVLPFETGQPPYDGPLAQDSRVAMPTGGGA